MKHLMTLTVTSILLLLTAVGAGQEQAESRQAQERFFTDQVRTLLEKRCWECHAEEVQESGLRLDSLKNLRAGGSSGKTLAAAGKPAESYLIEVLRYEGDVAMPPDEKLPEEEIAVLTRWVNMGLPWPVEGSRTEVPLTQEEKYSRQLEQHWAFQPLVAPPLPAVIRESWIAEPLDCFVLARLESKGLTPSPRADRYTLIRRLKFDLSGLPPTHDEVQAFVNDAAPDAYKKIVERFLNSPQYGERWGRHWLDVARYADTRGYAFTRERRYPFAYTYRDYVIEAFNRDLPYDQFILEQLAADLMGLESNHPALAALGLLTVGRKFNNRHLDIDDQIDVVGRGLLGLTVACARCHDHKYDPIPTEDYYSLYGVFASSQEPDELPIIGDPKQTPGYAEFKQELDRRQAELDAFKQKKCDEISEAARRHATDYLVRAITGEKEESLQDLPYVALTGEEFKPRLVQRWREILARTAKADHPVLGPLFQLAQLPDREYSEKAASVLEHWRSVPGGLQTGQLNPIVKAALDKEPPLTKLDLARVYGQLFSSVYARQQEGAANLASTSQALQKDAPEKPVPEESALPEAAPENLETAMQSPETEAAADPASKQILDILAGPGSLTDVTIAEVSKLLTRAEGNTYRDLERKVESFQVDSPGSPPRAMVVRESNTLYQPRVFIRGNHARLGKEVPRQFLLAIAGFDRHPFDNGSGRLELAQAIVSPDNPLTARVLVNRVWLHHFGAALVNTPSDFGTRSDPPVQADTLDHLASQFIANDWSLKNLHRSIVLSNTYQQASDRRAECEAIDPENMLYWRVNRRRLEFEAMRDAMLAVASELDLTMGGRPEELTKEPFSLRRAVYGYLDRQDLPGLFRVFDLASPDQSCPARPRTTVPQQALFIMNSPFVIERAKHIVALSTVMSAEGVPQRIEALYRTVLARPPLKAELEIGQRFIEVAGQAPADKGKPDVWQQYAQVLLMSNAFMFVD